MSKSTTVKNVSNNSKSFRIDDLLSKKSVNASNSRHASSSPEIPETNHIYGEFLKNSHRTGDVTDGIESTDATTTMLFHPSHLKYQVHAEEMRRRTSSQETSDSVRNVMNEIRKQELLFRYSMNGTNNNSRMPTGALGMSAYSPEQLPTPFPSLGPSLSHYREAMQRSNELVTSVLPIPFPYFNAHPVGLPAISAFRSLTDSLPTDDLDLARSFRHQASSLYEASLAYLGGNQSSFSMTSLLNGTGSKRKGGQIRFTNYQTSHLEKSFTEHKYLNANDRKKLANSLGLSDRQVKTWFQNRRAKWRKTKIDKNCTDIEGELSRSSFNERQSYSPDTANCDSSPCGSGMEENSP